MTDDLAKGWIQTLSRHKVVAVAIFVSVVVAGAASFVKDLSDLRAFFFPAPAPEAAPAPKEWVIYFYYDKSDLNPYAATEVDKIAEWLKEHPTRKVILEGHARVSEVGAVWTESEEAPTPEQMYGLETAINRTKSIAERLRRQGVSSSRIFETAVGIKQPLDEGESDEAMAKNSAVRIVAN